MSQSMTHPLMPGVRSSEINNPAWPRVLHDGQITGFSPLTCGMTDAPGVWRTIDVGGELSWIKRVKCADGAERLFVDDGRLRHVETDGTVLWTLPSFGSMVFFGDLRGDGRDYAAFTAGHRLTVVDVEAGEVFWRHAFDPPHTVIKVDVADALPERPGLEMAVFQQYGESGYLLTFPPSGPPVALWGRETTTPDDGWPERADHGCHVHFDLSDPDEPVIWNMRHHRVRGFEVRTGRMITELFYELGNELGHGYKRNYGPTWLGRDADGNVMFCEMSERVQTHVHAVRLSRTERPELAWQRYYGEVYVVPGVVVEAEIATDADGDGVTEMVYSARDPHEDFRSFVRVRDCGTGEIEAEFPDHWCAGYLEGFGAAGRNLLFVHPAPDGAMSKQGPLAIWGFDDEHGAITLADFDDARRWGPLTVPGEGGDELLLWTRDDDGAVSLVRLSEPANDAIVARTDAPALLESPIRQTITNDGERLYLVAGSRGTLDAVTWEGERLWSLPLTGGAPPLVLSLIHI